MNRVLVTGGAGTIGSAVVRRLLRDPGFEVRVSDQREPPQWMREGCEIHTGDLRDIVRDARGRRQAAATSSTSRRSSAGSRTSTGCPHTLTEVNNALYNAVVRAALDHDVERFVYVSSSMVFERATQFPTPEEHLLECPMPRSAYGFSKLTGEVYCRAAAEEHGLRYTICRPFNAYGPGELPDAEPGIAHAVPDLIAKVLAGPAPAADLRVGRADAHAHPRRRHRRRDRHRHGLAGRRGAGLQHLGLRGAHRGRDRRDRLGGLRRPADELELEHLPSFEVDVQRRWPSVEKARRMLGWEAQIELRDGIAGTVEWLRERVTAPVTAQPAG